jgi:hypothetical protein
VRQPNEVDGSSQPGAFADMPEVGEQAVGDIDGGGGEADQGLTEGDARARLFQCGHAQARPRFGQLDPSLQSGEAEAGQPGTAGDPDQVAGAGAVAAQGLARVRIRRARLRRH